MSEIQIDRKPRQRFPRRRTDPAMSDVLSLDDYCGLAGAAGADSIVQLRRLAHDARHRFLPEELEDLLHLELLVVARGRHAMLLLDTLVSITVRMFAISSSSCADPRLRFGEQRLRCRWRRPGCSPRAPGSPATPVSMIFSTGTPNALSDASTICFLTGTGVSAGRLVEKGGGLGEPIPFLGLDAGGGEDAVEIHAATRGRGGFRLEHGGSGRVRRGHRRRSGVGGCRHIHDRRRGRAIVADNEPAHDGRTPIASFAHALRLRRLLCGANYTGLRLRLGGSSNSAFGFGPLALGALRPWDSPPALGPFD